MSGGNSPKNLSTKALPCGLTPLSIAVLILLTVQTSLSTIMMRYSRTVRQPGETGAPHSPAARM